MGDNLFDIGGSSTETTDDTSTDASPTTTTPEHGDTGTENATVYVEGEPITIDGKTTAGDLKDIAGAADEELLTFRDDDQPETIHDDEYVLDHAAPGTKFEFQPVAGEDGGVFG